MERIPIPEVTTIDFKDVAIRALHWLTDQVHHQPPLHELQVRAAAGEITRDQADSAYEQWWIDNTPDHSNGTIPKY